MLHYKFFVCYITHGVKGCVFTAEDRSFGAKGRSSSAEDIPFLNVFILLALLLTLTLALSPSTTPSRS